MEGSVVPAADAFFLHAERTGAAQHVGGVVVLDPTDTRPSIDDVRALVGDGFARLPRMHQRLVPSTRWRRPRWVEAEDVDLGWHVAEHQSWAGRAGLLRLVGELAEQPMPRDRPLWRIVLVRDVGPRRPGVAEQAGGLGFSDALVVLLHHAIADGIGTVLQVLSLFEPLATVAVPGGHLRGRLARAAAVIAGLAQFATDGTATSWPRGSSRRDLAIAAVEFDVVRRLAASREVRVTDLLIALVADGVHAVSPGLPRAMRLSVTTMVRIPDSTAEGNATPRRTTPSWPIPAVARSTPSGSPPA